MRTALCILLLNLFVQTAAKAEFTFNKECLEAQKNILSLKLDAGATMLEIEKKAHPANAIPYFLENYIDIYRIFISEDKSEFDRLYKNKETRLAFIRKSAKTSPWFLYSQAEINLQWAFAHVKFGQYLSASLEIKKAHALLEENLKKFPDFKATNKSLGLLRALVGNIPDSYKWIANLLAFRGNTQDGMRMMHEFVATESKLPEMKYFQKEAAFLTAYMEIIINKEKNKSWDLICRYTPDYAGNLFSCFARAYVAKASGRNDIVIDLLQKRPQGRDYIPFYYLDFMIGECKLFRSDKDADIYLKRYVSLFTGQNYIKDGYQKLAWHYLVNNREDLYKLYMSMGVRYGKAETDEDKHALKDATSGEVPNVVLLRARLYFDGAYYQKAMSYLSGYTINSFTTEKDRLEYVYRMGRISHESGQYLKAIEWYGKTINLGSGLTYYFAANSSLQLGVIYEKLGQKDLAKTYFKKCFEFGKHEYKNSIEQKAKIGLKRLEEK
jgi:tetratricopeptide (TPR) repeat protein